MVASLPALAQWIGRPAPQWEDKFQVWIADVHQRVYPNSFGRNLDERQIQIQACRNEFVAFQLAVRSPEPVQDLRVRASDMVFGKAMIRSRSICVRYPGLIPVDENAQYTPDPLWEAASVKLEARQSQGVWIDFQVPEATPPGVYRGSVEVLKDGRAASQFQISLQVLPATLPPPTGYHCYLNILVDPASVARFQKLPLWGEEHWRQLEKYVRDLAGHGQKTITAFIVDDPWNSITGFPVRSLIEWKNAGEWKAGDANALSFDYSQFDRFVAMCLDAGIRDHIEAWSPLVQPHTDYSMITYTDTTANQSRRLRLEAGSPEYKLVWGTFVRAFQDHLRQKGWLDKTYLAFDEIATGVLDRVVPLFHETAPDLKLMISGGDEEGRHMAESRELAFHYGYYSAGSGAQLPDIPARRRAGKRTLLYTAVTPLYPNTFLFSEPLESRYLGWIVWKWDFDGYIRWAWNFWPATLWDQPFFTWHSGDMFFVYPGPGGPVDSLRWEMLRQGLEDYECLWLARKGLDELAGEGRHADFVQKNREALKHAVELATQQFDRDRIPRDPIPARMDEARRTVNQILIGLDALRQQAH
ncbi:MAG TPA: glycoside hydrolase domain-containing protein [Bryobacteraceae bacterium]|nr:glycoside hydrolase domain-containing protein [Bryobacteraceae bacterium]